ncbi:hypothetical protein OU798_05380 [Prolixibacteraceae bacterium Z1-6]|uniref:Uncharacterized protein n=1 Tax=Draconibacterium aestuarii TaxID=2998507 RepID=A0A9X3F3I5_9BACT|nr:hypothetical protein [Prolixibacteraceae bacterium Z1-6]
MKHDNPKIIHDKYAPYWAIALVVFAGTGLATIWIDLGAFWKGYVLDITGPAWNYILFRGLFTAYANNVWTRFFTPKRTLTIFLLVCFGIETMQLFNVYEATFDLWDLLAYISILFPLFFIDLKLNKQSIRSVE